MRNLSTQINPLKLTTSTRLDMWPETILLLGLRSTLFVTCRRYILSSLYSDLQELSSPSLEDGGDIEMKSSLPAPSTAPAPRSPAHSSIPQSIFALCFSESCMLFLLLMLQAVDIFSPATRLLNWRISLWTLLCVIILFIPLASSILLTNPSAPDILSPKSLLSLVFVLGALFLLSSIPLPSALASHSFLSASVARLIVLGTTILGLLSGFGAMRSCWSFLIASRAPVPTERDIEVSKSALARIREDLAKRRQMHTPQQTSWFKRASDDAQEIQGLEALEYQMSMNLDELKHTREQAALSRTLYGRISNIAGRVFAVYCVFRTITALVNLLFPSLRQPASTQSYPDLAAEIVSYVSGVPFERVSVVSRQLGLLFVGFIILSSIRLVLRGVTSITKRGLGASLMMLLLAQLMGIYLLSTIVQLRTSFPPPPGEGENLFATIPEFEVFGALFDGAFVGAAAAYGAVLWGKRMFVDGGPE